MAPSVSRPKLTLEENTVTDIRMRLHEQYTAKQYVLSCVVSWEPIRAVAVWDGMLLPTGRIIQVDGGIQVITSLDPCDGTSGWCWKVTITTKAGVVVGVFYVLVPDSPAMLDFEDLQQVDPATMQPGSGVTAWQTVLDAITTIRDQVQEIAEGINTNTTPPGMLNVANYASLKAAIAALPVTGGTVYVPIGRWWSGVWSLDEVMNKPDVRIVGERLPTWDADLSQLDGGSIIEGRFYAYAHGFQIDNIGFDSGYDVTLARYPSADTTTYTHPDSGGWDGFAFVRPSSGDQSARSGLKIGRIIGLVPGPTAYGHAVLIEGAQSGSVSDVVGIGGIHGVAVKSRNLTIGSLTAYGTSGNGVILKSDDYALCGNLQVGTVRFEPYPVDTTPHWGTSTVTGAGLMLNPETADFTGPVQIGSVLLRRSTYGLSIGDVQEHSITDVQIGRLHYEGESVTGSIAIKEMYTWVDRFKIDDLVVNNSERGIQWNTLANGARLDVGRAEMTNVTIEAVAAITTGKVRITDLILVNVATAYNVDTNARVEVGRERFTTVTTRFGNSPPALGTGWSSTADTAEVFLDNFGAAARGTVLAGSGVVGTIFTLPSFLAPAHYVRHPGLSKPSAGSYGACMLNATSGKLTIDDDTAPASGTNVSLDGMAWGW